MATDDLEKGLLDKLLSRFPFLSRRQKPDTPRPLDVPWTEPMVPLRESVVALITTGGVHLHSQPPFNCEDSAGDASYREIPVQTPRESLSITHDYYDHLDAESDLNLVLPIQRLLEFQKAGALGRLHPVAYSLMGHVMGSKMEELEERTSVAISMALAAAQVNYALLVPA